MKPFALAFLFSLFLAVPALGVTLASSPLPRDKVDAQTNTRVMNKLFSDRYFSTSHIDVTTNEGIVTLAGQVNDLRSKQRAVSIAENTDGVHSVIDRMVIRGGNVTDADIAGHVQEALHLDASTANLPINVQSQAGVVTLTGKVRSWGEKALAEWVAAGVNGVRSVQNNILITFQGAVNDNEISNEVKAFLRQDPWLYSRAIDVAVTNGRIVLSGRVGSQAEKRRAELAAWGTKANSIDSSNLLVDPNLFSQNAKARDYTNRSDDQIAKDIKSALFYDPRVSSLDVNVEVHNKVATLTGSVDSLEAKWAAINDTLNTVGVFSVASHIGVAQNSGTTDQRIVDDVVRLLELEPVMSPYKIRVSSNAGVVALHGDVGTGYERWLAEQTAARVKGVVDVKNQVQVMNLLGSEGGGEQERNMPINENLFSKVIYEREFPLEAFTLYPSSVDPQEIFTAANRASRLSELAQAAPNKNAQPRGLRVSQRERRRRVR